MPETSEAPLDDLLGPVETMPATLHLLPAPVEDESGLTWAAAYDDGQTDAVASLTFDGATTRLSTAPALAGTEREAYQGVAALLTVASVLDATHTALCRRRAHHPGTFGLTPRHMVEAQGHTPLVWRMHSDAYLAQIAERVPAALWSPTIGWFTPDSDPAVFGTPYLLPLGDDIDARWAMFQVGVGPTEDRSAAWHDAAAIAQLAAACGEDPELALTMAALSDTQKVANDARIHLLRIQTLAARDFFAAKADQVRPRLVGDILHEAQRAVAGGGTGRYGRASEHPLTPYQVYGYSYGRSRPKAVYAAASLSYDTRTSVVEAEAEADRAATMLAGLLDVRGLGRVVRVSEPGMESVYVTQRPDGLRQFPVAFGISESATMRVLPTTYVAPTRQARRSAATASP